MSYLFAGGSQEEELYKAELQQLFAEILEDIYTNNTSADSAKKQTGSAAAEVPHIIYR